VDGVILAFSLEDEVSFNTVYTYHSQMMQYRSGLRDIPVILVGTQDSISEANPRLIDDGRSRLLANELKCSAYYETCATYGLNVERVFHDGMLNSPGCVC
jgi:Arf-GAP/GTPase/ANK repeat/PH domain-containing protein 1/3